MALSAQIIIEPAPAIQLYEFFFALHLVQFLSYQTVNRLQARRQISVKTFSSGSHAPQKSSVLNNPRPMNS